MSLFRKKPSDLPQVFQAIKPDAHPNPKPDKPKIDYILNSVTVVNNRTDKEYKYESVNDLGLDWAWDTDGSLTLKQKINIENWAWDTDGSLTLKQKINIENWTWEAIGIFYGFSIIKVERKIIPVSDTVDK